MQRQHIRWLIDLCVIGTLLVAIAIIASQGVFYWWFQSGSINLAIVAIWLKFVYREGFSQQQRLSYGVGVAFAIGILLHGLSWFPSSGHPVERYGLNLLLFQDVLTAAAVLAFYFQPRQRFERQ